jgi:hypothetical protein
VVDDAVPVGLVLLDEELETGIEVELLQRDEL